jgi:hypothetical protein
MVGFTSLLASIRTVYLKEGDFFGDTLVNEEGDKVKKVTGIPIEKIESKAIVEILIGLFLTLVGLLI